MVPIEISYSTLMGRKAKAAAAAAAAAFAGTESAFGRHLSSPGSSTVRKRLRDSSENLPTHFSIPGSSTLWKRLLDSSENPPTPAGSIRHIGEPPASRLPPLSSSINPSNLSGKNDEISNLRAFPFSERF
jgi:hypothetical protein